MRHDDKSRPDHELSESELRRRVAEQSVEGLPPSRTVRQWRGPVVLLSVGLISVVSGAIGFSVSGTYGVAVASVFVVGCLLALSPVLGAAAARKRDEVNAAHAS